jgi:excisionase family DNA binding protein
LHLEIFLLLYDYHIHGGSLMLDLQDCLTIDVLPVCDLLKMSRSHVYNLLKSGRLPGRKIGGQWRIPVDGLRRYLTVQGTTSVSEMKTD